MTNTTKRGNPQKYLVTGLFAIVSLLGGSNLGAAEDQAKTRVPLPKVVIERGDKCVEPTADMRRYHMDYIQHQRDETTRKGIRTKDHSLKNCVDCHASPKTNSVLGKDGFCESCHTYASVTIDCFSCHSASPEKPTAPVVGGPRPADSHIPLSFKQTKDLSAAEMIEGMRTMVQPTAAGASTSDNGEDAR